MREDCKTRLASAAYEITRKASERVDVRRHLHDLLWGDDFEQWWSEKVLEIKLRNAVKERDTSLLEFIGRNIPAKDDEVPQAPQRVRMAEYIRYNLIGDIENGTPAPVVKDEDTLVSIMRDLGFPPVDEIDWGDKDDEPERGRLPKRKEVADKLGIDIKKVSEFYAELAEETGLNLDERSKTNVWFLERG